MSASKSALGVIFVTVFLDLVGFGMIIPLVGIYGRHFGASVWELALLGSIYSIMQFIFSPIWGRLSDKKGRRPILLMSLLGSVFSYSLFAVSHFLPSPLVWLTLSRALAGIFAANISTAQAYIADVTPPQDRAKGMGLIGAAFGIGFTLGPPIGGLSSAAWGLWAPGALAAGLCFLNWLMAVARLKESLDPQNRRETPLKERSRLQQLQTLKRISRDPKLFLPVISTFFATFAFSNLEQVFSLLIQSQFSLATEEAGKKTGFVLMWSGILGAVIQGGLIRKWVPRFGEVRLAIWGFWIQGAAMLMFSHSPNYAAFFITAIPLALGSGLINPTLAALVSQRAGAHEQGEVIGLKEGLSSLARVFGPFVGLLAFGVEVHLPFIIAAVTVFGLGAFWIYFESRPSKSESL